MKKIIFSTLFLLTANIANAQLVNPLKDGITDVPSLIGIIIQSLLGITGSIALIMFIYGGLMWLISAGNKEKVDTGKKTIMYATMGLVIIFTSYAILKFVFSVLTPSL